MVQAGSKARASDIKTVRSWSKAATETVTSSTTLQDDDHIAGITLEAGKSYRALLVVTVSSGGDEAADIKLAWATTATITKSARTLLGPALAMTDATTTTMRASATALTSSVSYGIDGGAAAAIIEELLLEDVTVAGTLKLQWAQQASSGTGTTLSTSTRVYVEEIEVQ